MPSTVDKNMKLHDLQEEFAGAFPFLKLEFLVRVPRKGMSAETKPLYPNGTR